MAFLRKVSGTAADNNGVKSACDRFFYADDGLAARKGNDRYVYAEASSVWEPLSSTDGDRGQGGPDSMGGTYGMTVPANARGSVAQLSQIAT